VPVQRWDHLHTPGIAEAPAEPRAPDVRSQYARDRDRIIYTSAFRRLAGVTQVVSSAEDPHIFHNRQSHTIETAQIARRLAEQLLARQGELVQQLGCHPEVADAAALAHDLGHPPFGHLGEETLDEVLTKVTPDPGGDPTGRCWRPSRTAVSSGA
jgi:dGTPase